MTPLLMKKKFRMAGNDRTTHLVRVMTIYAESEAKAKKEAEKEMTRVRKINA